MTLRSVHTLRDLFCWVIGDTFLFQLGVPLMGGSQTFDVFRGRIGFHDAVCIAGSAFEFCRLTHGLRRTELTLADHLEMQTISK